jgi:alpha/beta superfamily hydrolase
MITVSKASIISIITGLLLFLVLICVILSYYLSFYIALLLLLLIIWCILRFLINLLVFPGSYKFWLKLIESHYSKELSDQASQKLGNFSKYLISLKGSNESQTFSESSIRLYQKLISSLINNFSYLEVEGQITSDQKAFLLKLTGLKTLLLTTKVDLIDDFQLNIWEFIENPESGATVKDLDLLEACIKTTEELVQFIQMKANRSFVRGGFLFGTLEYMRADLFKRFTCEQFWVEGEGCLIDCVWISGIITTDSSPVIIFCNPNAAYYEFSYFQTDWIELYVMSGVNLVLWNYRGYGRSTGSPDLQKMKKDAEKVANFIKTKKKFRNIGIHGESLGGCIASHLAFKIQADFLFADRTFQSLSSTARFNYGSAAECLFKLFGPRDSDVVQDFVSNECFKVLSCDCNDIMINNLGSLKAGVAFQYFLKCPQFFPFNQDDIGKITLALRKIQSLAGFRKKDDRTVRRVKKRGSIDTGNVLKTLVNYLDEILVIVDAGGQSFMDLFLDCDEDQVRNWICVLGIWGSTPEVYSHSPSNNLNSALLKFQLTSKELQSIITEFEKCENPSVHSLLLDFHTILSFLSKCENWISSLKTDEKQTGKLLPLTCGHNGSFTSLERYLYEQHLQSAGIF